MIEFDVLERAQVRHLHVEQQLEQFLAGAHDREEVSGELNRFVGVQGHLQVEIAKVNIPPEID